MRDTFKKYKLLLIVFILTILISLVSIKTIQNNKSVMYQYFGKNKIYDSFEKLNYDKITVNSNVENVYSFFKNKNNLENSFFNEQDKLILSKIKKIVFLTNIFLILFIIFFVLTFYFIIKKNINILIKVYLFLFISLSLVSIFEYLFLFNFINNFFQSSITSLEFKLIFNKNFLINAIKKIIFFNELYGITFFIFGFIMYKNNINRLLKS